MDQPPTANRQPLPPATGPTANRQPVFEPKAQKSTPIANCQVI
jgi:hypothetical protein